MPELIIICNAETVHHLKVSICSIEIYGAVALEDSREQKRRENYMSRRFSPQLTTEGAELKLPPLLMNPGSGSSEFESSSSFGFAGTHLVPSKSVVCIVVNGQTSQRCNRVMEFVFGIEFLQVAHSIVIGFASGRGTMLTFVIVSTISAKRHNIDSPLSPGGSCHRPLQVATAKILPIEPTATIPSLMKQTAQVIWANVSDAKDIVSVTSPGNDRRLGCSKGKLQVLEIRPFGAIEVGVQELAVVAECEHGKMARIP